MIQQILFDSTQKIGFKSDIIIAQSLANVQINTCDKYVTSHIHEQILVIDNFICHIKTGRLVFRQMYLPHKIRANVLMQIKLVT